MSTAEIEPKHNLLSPDFIDFPRVTMTNDATISHSSVVYLRHNLLKCYNLVRFAAYASRWLYADGVVLAVCSFSSNLCNPCFALLRL